MKKLLRTWRLWIARMRQREWEKVSISERQQVLTSIQLREWRGHMYISIDGEPLVEIDDYKAAEVNAALDTLRDMRIQYRLHQLYQSSNL